MQRSGLGGQDDTVAKFVLHIHLHCVLVFKYNIFLSDSFQLPLKNSFLISFSTPVNRYFRIKYIVIYHISSIFSAPSFPLVSRRGWLLEQGR